MIGHNCKTCQKLIKERILKRIKKPLYDRFLWLHETHDDNGEFDDTPNEVYAKKDTDEILKLIDTKE